MKQDDYCEFREYCKEENIPTVFTAAEAMDILEIGKNTIYRLLNTGQLQGVRVGRSWRISLDSIQTFLCS